jgi:uncharacterized protein YndB with AHSA1/START domain
MNRIDGPGQTLRIERLIPMPADQLFALWVEPAQIVRWWAPDGYQAVVDRLEVRQGGRWRIVLRDSSDAELAVGGLFHVVEPARQLVFSWAWEDEEETRGGETEVTVIFEPAPGGARLILSHRNFNSEDARNRHLAGWSAGLERLMNLKKDKHPC